MAVTVLPTKTVTLKVAPEAYDEWQGYAERRGLNLSEMIRQSVTDCLPTEGDVTVQERLVVPKADVLRWQIKAKELGMSTAEYIRGCVLLCESSQ